MSLTFGGASRFQPLGIDPATMEPIARSGDFVP